MENLHLEIDYRESKIIELMKKYEFAKQSITNLPVGDFIIKKADEILFIIERKTISDLSSSITDGRFRNQKSRLSEIEPSKIIYIIEGSYNEGKYLLPRSTIDSAILNLIFKHKFNVIFTESPEHTLLQILSLFKKIQNNELTLTEQNQPVKLLKKSHNFNCFTNMLSVIPGVSNKIAQCIVDKYKTLPNLMNEFKDLPELLSTIQTTDKRKLGVVLSKKIHANIYICGQGMEL